RLALLALPAHATPEYILPTLFNVTDVEADDVLNIRAEPSARAAIIGRLAHDRTHVEVVEERSGWGRVNSGEGSGWVSMRYLAYRSDVWRAGKLPASFTCHGTEPFWGLSVRQGQLIYSDPETPENRRPVRNVLNGAGYLDHTMAILAEGVTVSVVPQLCSDGMSDMRFGLRASVILQDRSAYLLQGCCSIQP
ncbi:MAG: COG3650 family protein, partial [Paracoccus sp. (in: a-proteobacteria)]